MLPEGAHLRDTDFTVFFLDFDTLEDFTPPARHLSDSDETETYVRRSESLFFVFTVKFLTLLLLLLSLSLFLP